MKVKLEVQPVKRYKKPKYPTKEKVSENPAILYRVPDRWKGSPALYAALLLVVSGGLYACSGQGDGSETNGPAIPGDPASAVRESVLPSALEPTALPPASVFKVPVFEHGSGRGSYGCVSVAPPVFLSEEEALQVIREEAEAQGIDFSGTRTLTGTFPATNLYGDKTLEDATWKGELELDGYDEALGFGFEFVSRQDLIDWQVQGNIASSVESYELKATAERLAAAAENMAVFYDPSQNWEEFDWNTSEKDFEAYVRKFSEEQKTKMIENLREQVRDFLAWLAAEGVI